MISSVEIEQDDATFPIVSWRETRGLGASTENGEAAVECRLMRRSDGELMFVAIGPKRGGYGVYEDGRPWRLLKGIAIVAADNLFKTAGERQMMERLAGKSLAARLSVQDGAQVFVAEFHGERPIYINETTAPLVALNQLHAHLLRQFIDRRKHLVADLCSEEEFKWLRHDGRVRDYDPDRTATQSAKRTWVSIADKAVAAAIILAFVALAVWVAIRLFR